MKKFGLRGLSIVVSYKFIIAFGLVSLILGTILEGYLTLDTFLASINELQTLAEESKITFASICILIYSIIVIFSIPVASVLTLSCGYLFGSLIGGFIAFIGALTGASILFLIVRFGLKMELVERLKSSSIFSELSLHIYENQFRHLLFLRFLPLFPFWMINLAPAILGVKFKLFFFSTFIGIIPGTFIIAGIGEKVRNFSEPKTVLLNELIANPEFVLLFLALSLITIFPTVLKLFSAKTRKKKRNDFKNLGS